MGMRFVRYGIPAAMFLAGVLIAILDSDHQRGLEVGGMVVGGALTVLLMNVLFRIGVEGDKDRDKEDAARAFFDEHGYWPDERRQRQS
jgi:hypothetical protein